MSEPWATRPELWDELRKVECPVLLIGGGSSDALLKPEHIEQYCKHLKSVEVVVFEDSGLNVSEPDYDSFIGRVISFSDRTDLVELRSPRSSQSSAKE